MVPVWMGVTKHRADRHRASRSAERLTADRARRRRRSTTLARAAFSYTSDQHYVADHTLSIGSMFVECQHCRAKKFNGETPGMCCAKGKVVLPPLAAAPEPLASLLAGTHVDSRDFLRNVMRYNACFQMTSFGATRECNDDGWMPTFKVQGQVYHLTGSLLPVSPEEPKFMQIYFIADTAKQVDRRCSVMPGLKPSTVQALQTMLHAVNPYIQGFKCAIDRLSGPDMRVVIRADKRPAGEHERRYNAPTTDDVGIIVVGEQCERRDIVLETRSNSLKRVAETHRSYDALQYPLIFWDGHDGYHFQLTQTDGKKLTAMRLYAYRLMIRDADSAILHYRQLFHQFVVDMWAKIESERLRFIRLHQKQLRVENYVHLQDAVASDGSSNVGRLVILPATFTGSPRYLQQYTQDAIAYVRKYGRPDLFITFTCNSQWDEIHDGLFAQQSSSDRHDLIARVFRQKVIIMLRLLTKESVFGDMQCYIYSVEWQKRGLPHIHILLWLKEKIKPTEMDSIISAEIPDKDADPRLYDVITTTMLHGPCGPVNPRQTCMKDGHCTKHYPRPFVLDTQTGHDGYPLYRRRSPEQGGRTASVYRRGQQVTLDNRWVVPYCPFLSSIFNAHINVEYCHSVKSIKYVLKYIHKGSDQAAFGLQDSDHHDEVENYQLGRYISSNEAVWRILDFPVHERYPSVMHLHVHLENGERVYFTADNIAQRLQQGPPRTKLTAFFELCKSDSFAATLLYCDVPTYYTWQESSKSFQRRKQGKPVDGRAGIFQSDVVGRVYTVHPSNAECFYLRLLLHQLHGPTSFDDLKTVDGELCETFREACQRRGLLESDRHWFSAMEEAASSQLPRQLRQLFAVIISVCVPSNPRGLFDAFREAMAEDMLLQLRRRLNDDSVSFCDDIFNELLVQIDDTVQSMTGKPASHFGLPSPDRCTTGVMCKELLREQSYDKVELENYVAANEPLLTPDQQAAYDHVIGTAQQADGGIMFIDAPGGTGKTYLLNLILAKIRISGIAIAVSSSGIAATLLHGGRTAHSTFKLPLNLSHTESPVCNIARGSGLALLLQRCQLIVWDECTMSHKGALEAVDRTLRDLRQTDRLMGGVLLLLSGDFRQTLPVIPRGTPADELKACLKSSYLWRHIKTLHLQTNMRVQLLGDATSGDFARDLLKIGEGQISVNAESGTIELPASCGTIVESAAALIEQTFPDVANKYTDHRWIRSRAILAPKNISVNNINTAILNVIPGEMTVYTSIDTVVDVDDSVNYPTEFLNSLEPPGMPPHKLQLKVGVPIMLLRNLDPPKLCNGTRLTVKQLMANVIDATILTGAASGESVFIPRIPLIPTDLPFEFKRLQFPVRPAFAMTVNKAQGQSLTVAGVDLTEPCFSHGQLYVALSRVGTPAGLFVLATDGQTKNIVYQNALL